MKNKNLDMLSRKLMHKGVGYANDMLTNTGQLLGYYDFIETYHIANKRCGFLCHESFSTKKLVEK